MTAQTRLSAKGQVVIPKDVRDRLRLQTGETFDVIDTPQGVLLKRTAQKSGRSFEEIIARIQEIAAPYRGGEPATIAEMDEAVAAMFRDGREHYWD